MLATLISNRFFLLKTKEIFAAILLAVSEERSIIFIVPIAAEKTYVTALLTANGIFLHSDKKGLAMKVNENDSQYLLSLGYNRRDIAKIKFAVSQSKYIHGCDIISSDKAVKIVGREAFLSGIAESTFYETALREPLDQTDYRMVCFDSSILFE